MDAKNTLALIEKYCLNHDLTCHDPYDVWMTKLGISVKQGYNKNKWFGIVPAACVTIYDHFLNNTARIGYKKREYPTARATAALTLINTYQTSQKEVHLAFAKVHIDWLIANTCKGYSGLCWGLGFKWAAGDGLDYGENTPFSTHTPYALEAIHKYIMVTGDSSYVQHIQSIFEFFENDIQIMFEDAHTMATSYGPQKDRLITNAVSYALYAYAIFSQYLPEKRCYLKNKTQKLYNFLTGKQLADGSWLYEPENPGSFIDCFHSCFVLKNIYKANVYLDLEGSDKVMALGYDYVKLHFYNGGQQLFKRFTLSNKPSLVHYDLYDNAEMLHLAVLFGDQGLTSILSVAIEKNFVVGQNVYSVIDLFGSKRNKNMLRWAVMPYLYAISAQLKAEKNNLGVFSIST